MTNPVTHQRHKYHPLTIQRHFDFEDDYRSGCRNVSHCHQQFFSELHTRGDHTREATDSPGFKPFTMLKK